MTELSNTGTLGRSTRAPARTKRLGKVAGITLKRLMNVRIHDYMHVCLDLLLMWLCGVISSHKRTSM